MKVLTLATYPIEAAATRFRLIQFVGPLAERGIELDIRPFLDGPLFAALYSRDAAFKNAVGLSRSILRRCRDIVAGRRYDALLVQREAMLLGPPVVEYLLSRLLSRPMVLDLDDATYLRYESPTYGRLAAALKCFGKTDDLIRWSRVVTCGSHSIAEHVERRGTRAVLIPTVVDTDLFRPAIAPVRSGPPVIGWIGTHSTYPYLEAIYPALERLGRTHHFRLKIVGAGREKISLPGVDLENLAWCLEREISDFQSFDIGLYPITPDPWSIGKSGFKAVQYLAVGTPYVATPVGVLAEIGEPGVTHLEASSVDDWYDALCLLLTNVDLRNRMGEAGRQHSLRYYTLPDQADKLAQVLYEVAG